MVSTKLAALAALLPLAYAGKSRAMESPGVLSFPVTGREAPDLDSGHSKRHLVVGAVNQLGGTIYTIEVSFGTPGTTIPVQIDTGGTELWVNPDCSKAHNSAFCNEQPRFTESSSLKKLDKSGELKYRKGSVSFDWVEDCVEVAGARVSKQRFGLGLKSDMLNVGMLGMAPSLDGWENKNPSLVDNLKSQGYIDSRSFGMDLRGIRGDDGAVIFGGLDTKKFTGKLQKLPVVDPADAPEKVARWWVRLDGISVTNGDGDSTTVLDKPNGEGEVVVVDSGYTITALPPPIFEKLLKAFPGAEKRNDEMGLYRVDCLPTGEGGYVSFRFGETTIKVPYHDFVWKLSNEENYCILGAFGSEKGVLGDTFLRSAYTIFDFDQRTVHMAQSANCGSNIVKIGSDGVGVEKGDC